MAGNRYKGQGLTKEQIEQAMRVTPSNNAAARYLGVGIQCFKKYASMYYDETGEKTLYEKHKNWYGIGIPKGFAKAKESTALMDILEGKVSPASFTAEKLKKELIKEGLIEEKCESCGYCQKRELDYKVPVILTFRDGNKRNWKRENLFLLCHNCYYLQIGDIYSKRQMEAIEGMVRTKSSSTEKELEIDKIHLDLIKDIVNNNSAPYIPPDQSGEDLIFKI